MAVEEYGIKAFFEVDPRGLRGLNRISSALQGLGSRLSGTRGAFGGLVRNAVAFGATYVGVRAVSSALRGLATTAFNANAEFETMRLSLAAVYSAVENRSLAQSLEDVSGIFERINILAAQTPATARDLIGIYSGIYGPLRAAGVGQAELLELTKNTSAAALALNVPLDVATAGIARMAQGAAGIENPLWRSLTSMGLIAEDAQTFNRLNPAERAERLQRAIEAIGGEASAEFGRTWVGISSTFVGLLEHFKRIFGGAMFTRIRDALKEVTDTLGEYRVNIERVVEGVGVAMGNALGRVLARARQIFTYVVANMDRIAARIDQAISRFNALRPTIEKLAKAMLAMKVAGLIFGPILSGLGSLLSIGGSLAAMGVTVGGTAAAGGGAAAGAAGAAAGGGAMAALGAALTPVLAVLGGIAAVGLAVWEAFEMFGPLLRDAVEPLLPMFMGIGSDIMEILGSIWEFIGPILGFVGGVLIAGLAAVFRILGGAFRVVLGVLKIFARIIGWVGRNVIRPIFEFMGEVFITFFNALGIVGRMLEALGEWIGDLVGAGEDPLKEGVEGPAGGFLARMQELFEGTGQEPGEGANGSGEAPGQRGGTTVDMRGSRINVRQEFRDADPDRVFIQMRDALEREATQRTQSPFVPALSR